MKIKSLLISDTHLGSSKSKSKKVLKVLRTYDFENLFLIGDIVDIIAKPRWTKIHYKVIETILRSKANVFYIAGNHDFYLRFLINKDILRIGNITLCDEYIYNALNGNRLLICHGDRFDGFVKVNPFLYKIGDKGYELSLKLNKSINYIRKKIGKKEYWSLSDYLKKKTKKAISYLNDFKNVVAQEVENKGCDGIIIGHLHTPGIELIGDKWYYNTGDFVESCSYIVEELSGDFKLKFA